MSFHTFYSLHFARRAFAIGASLLLASLIGCASISPVSNNSPGGGVPVHADQFIEGQWSGRFSLNVERKQGGEIQGRPAESAQGNFELSSAAGRSSLVLSNPLGQSLAKIQTEPGKAVLLLADGTRFEAADASEMLRQRLGWRIPVNALPRLLAQLDQQADGADMSGRLQKILGPDWAVRHQALGETRQRLDLSWDGIDNQISKLVITLILSKS